MALTLAQRYTFAASFLVLCAAVGLITGYIALDSEGAVRKFGLFVMIVSALTSILALFLKIGGLI